MVTIRIDAGRQRGNGMRSRAAMSLNETQKAPSRPTLVLRPPITIDRLTFWDSSFGRRLIALPLSPPAGDSGPQHVETECRREIRVPAVSVNATDERGNGNIFSVSNFLETSPKGSL